MSHDSDGVTSFIVGQNINKMLGRDAASQAQEEAEKWREYAKKLEEKCLDVTASWHAEAKLVTEILNEVDSGKPRVLSDRQNKAARDAVRNMERQRVLSTVKKGT